MQLLNILTLVGLASAAAVAPRDNEWNQWGKASTVTVYSTIYSTKTVTNTATVTTTSTVTKTNTVTNTITSTVTKPTTVTVVGPDMLSNRGLCTDTRADRHLHCLVRLARLAPIDAPREPSGD